MEKRFPLLLALLSPSLFAAPLTMDISLYENGKLVTARQLAAEDMQQHTIMSEGRLKFEITPEVRPRGVLLSSRLHYYQDGKFRLLSEPMMMVTKQKPATIEVGDEANQVYRVEVLVR